MAPTRKRPPSGFAAVPAEEEEEQIETPVEEIVELVEEIPVEETPVVPPVVVAERPKPQLEITPVEARDAGFGMVEETPTLKPAPVRKHPRNVPKFSRTK